MMKHAFLVVLYSLPDIVAVLVLGYLGMHHVIEPLQATTMILAVLAGRLYPQRIRTPNPGAGALLDAGSDGSAQQTSGETPVPPSPPAPPPGQLNMINAHAEIPSGILTLLVAPLALLYTLVSKAVERVSPKNEAAPRHAPAERLAWASSTPADTVNRARATQPSVY